MKQSALLLICLSLSGCVIYPGRTSAVASGIVSEQSGVPSKNAVVIAVVGGFEKWQQPYDFELTRTDDQGRFKVSAAAWSHHSWAIWEPISITKSVQPICAACRPGSLISYFPCNGASKVTLYSTEISKEERRAIRNISAHWSTVDSLGNLLSECDMAKFEKALPPN